MRHLGELIVAFASRNDAALGFRLAMLWPRWREVLGHVAPYAHPLGHRRATLLAGVEDALAMQESHYDAPAILEAVNGFLGQQVFDKVQFDLLQGKTPLDALPGSAPAFWRLPAPRIASLGKLSLDPNTAVGRTYAAYARQFGPGR
ncbi:hypothetical protein NNJEOMEG_00720 [Fundidesulfovibrio magnetotacticus]|uniref:Uncharacterized protein n=1 Tax=Fundidesulfovibrio magnetotacticus TaxID=2730080 RepID=A0A6V8LJH9_9BACT|nr:DUF721 domain-containing protein [Fundidesulfovibrio magnetotacticus]GFK92892.1 hypothetical protein NNJEOMEG_00720 [Fundidesulfovibrio magnetotacticus]